MLKSTSQNTFAVQICMSMNKDSNSKFKNRGMTKLDRLRSLMRSQKSTDFRRHSIEQSQRNFNIPIIQLNDVQLPVDSIPLNIFESRYRLMFKLLKDSVDRQFGVVWSRGEGELEEKQVGVLCELSHFLAMPQKGCVFVNGVGVGRFQINQILDNEPYVVANVENVQDVSVSQNQNDSAELQLVETQVWERLQKIRKVFNQLYPLQHPGDAILTQEAQRWCPDRHENSNLPLLPEKIIRKIDTLKLEVNTGEIQEFFCKYYVRDLSEDERRENFSFAALKGITQNSELLQKAIDLRDTMARFLIVEEELIKCQNNLQLLQEGNLE